MLETDSEFETFKKVMEREIERDRERERPSFLDFSFSLQFFGDFVVIVFFVVFV